MDVSDLIDLVLMPAKVEEKYLFKIKTLTGTELTKGMYVLGGGLESGDGTEATVLHLFHKKMVAEPQYPYAESTREALLK